MKRVRLDFAPPSARRTLLRATPVAWGLAFGGLSVCVAALTQVLHYREEREDVDVLLAALRARAAVPVAAPAALTASIGEPEAAAVNGAISKLNLPWRALHDAVRAATPPAVALLALEPDANKRVLRISAEAKNSDDMLAYVAALGQGKLFGAVTLVRHEVLEQDPNRPLRFQIDGAWGAP
jgi:Tfp pilus assembly protein PilN